MTNRVMLDLETLGTDPGCVVLSIGAVAFDEHGLGAEFHRSIDMESCEEAGLEIDANTLDWWLDQDEDAQHVLKGGAPIEDVLFAFASWYGDQNADEIWANSPSFDCSILAAAYDAVGQEEPWAYWEQRDVRTIAELPAAVDVEQEGTKHDALDDARTQARLVRQTLQRLDDTGWGEATDA